MINFDQTPEQIAEELIQKFEVHLLYVGQKANVFNGGQWQKEKISGIKSALQAVELMLEVCPQYIELIAGSHHNIKYQTLLQIQTILKNKLK